MSLKAIRLEKNKTCHWKTSSTSLRSEECQFLSTTRTALPEQRVFQITSATVVRKSSQYHLQVKPDRVLNNLEMAEHLHGLDLLGANGTTEATALSSFLEAAAHSWSMPKGTQAVEKGCQNVTAHAALLASTIASGYLWNEEAQRPSRQSPYTEVQLSVRSVRSGTQQPLTMHYARATPFCYPAGAAPCPVGNQPHKLSWCWGSGEEDLSPQPASLPSSSFQACPDPSNATPCAAPPQLRGAKRLPPAHPGAPPELMGPKQPIPKEPVPRQPAACHARHTARSLPSTATSQLHIWVSCAGRVSVLSRIQSGQSRPSVAKETKTQPSREAALARDPRLQVYGRRERQSHLAPGKAQRQFSPCPSALLPRCLHAASPAHRPTSPFKS
ncbi:hypothetical protein Anapl_14485 [Anas platyrhynchos]|uniref:Uncharacterized protein n=1 Tax=Anas platyrhynchos TaxID=8839 RepID=R0LQC0_ANAPL|nr:hypothetical protein Anapl_14485 [Anas platyrhynchos]